MFYKEPEGFLLYICYTDTPEIHIYYTSSSMDIRDLSCNNIVGNRYGRSQFTPK